MILAGFWWERDRARVVWQAVSTGHVHNAWFRIITKDNGAGIACKSGSMGSIFPRKLAEVVLCC